MPPMPRRDALKLISDTLKNKENDHELDSVKNSALSPKKTKPRKRKIVRRKEGHPVPKGQNKLIFSGLSQQENKVSLQLAVL